MLGLPFWTKEACQPSNGPVRSNKPNPARTGPPPPLSCRPRRDPSSAQKPRTAPGSGIRNRRLHSTTQTRRRSSRATRSRRFSEGSQATAAIPCVCPPSLPATRRRRRRFSEGSQAIPARPLSRVPSIYPPHSPPPAVPLGYVSAAVTGGVEHAAMVPRFSDFFSLDAI